MKVLDLDKISPNNSVILNEENLTNESVINKENNKKDHPIHNKVEKLENEKSIPSKISDETYWAIYATCGVLLGVALFWAGYWIYNNLEWYDGDSDSDSLGGMPSGTTTPTNIPQTTDFIEKYSAKESQTFATPIRGVIDKGVQAKFEVSAIEVQTDSPMTPSSKGVFPWFQYLFADKGVQASPANRVPTIIIESPTAEVNSDTGVVDYNVLPGDSMSQAQSPLTPSNLGLEIPISRFNQEGISPIDSRPETLASISMAPLKVLPKAGVEFAASLPLPVSTNTSEAGKSVLEAGKSMIETGSPLSSSEEIANRIPGSFITTKGRYSSLPLNVQEPFSETPVITPESSIGK